MLIAYLCLDCLWKKKKFANMASEQTVYPAEAENEEDT